MRILAEEVLSEEQLIEIRHLVINTKLDVYYNAMDAAEAGMERTDAEFLFKELSGLIGSAESSRSGDWSYAAQSIGGIRQFLKERNVDNATNVVYQIKEKYIENQEIQAALEKLERNILTLQQV